MSAAPKTTVSRVPLLIAILLGIVLGYGLGRFQSSQSVQAMQEKLETSETNRKIATEATAAVEKQSSRLIGRRYLDVSVKSLNGGNERDAHAALSSASKAFHRGETDKSRVITAKIDALLQGDLANKQKDIQAISAEFDSTILITAQEGGG